MNRNSSLAPALEGGREANLVQGFGPELSDRGVRFRLWAPKAGQVDLKLADWPEPLQMGKRDGGWFVLDIEGAGPGTRYSFVLEDGTEIPDPASRFQPDDISGMSEVIDPTAFAWTDADWRGGRWEEMVIYELHVGTFTREGTYRAVIDRLDHLVALGITAIELMPVADFPGQWNWGYDGALLFAPDSSYGRPEDLKALIDAAHARSISVFLDVVYNHFGPEGNYLPIYAPLFTGKHHTPWGAAVNYDDEGSDVVRALIIASACYWVEEFHFDGLRLDAVHEIRDDSERHVLSDIADSVKAAAPGRTFHPILENAHNQSHWLRRTGKGVPEAYVAQWNDDLHHCLHVVATGESSGYYADYQGGVDQLGRALAEGFVYQGQSRPTTGQTLGETSGFLPPTAFISFIQNHDQIGNRVLGERLTSLASPEALRAVAAIYLLCPQIPMLFMGEEWGARQPFLFFSDIQSLAANIREGRAKEFAAFLEAHEGDEQPADPMIIETLERCQLQWDEREQDEHAAWLALYRNLIKTRREHIVPRLSGMAGGSGRHERIGDTGLRVTWTTGDGSKLVLLANLSDEPLEDIDCWGGAHLWLQGHADGQTLGPWSVVWSVTGT